MTTVMSAFFLLAGSTICLVAALGVLRLPDFFLRMHAATKAGVAGAGLVLIGVAFSEPSIGMWVKVMFAIAFLLLTTPIAGHLLARAGYVAGVPLWGGTYQDELQRELPRGQFDRLDRPVRTRRLRSPSGAARTGQSGSVVLALSRDRAERWRWTVPSRWPGRPVGQSSRSPSSTMKMLASVGPVPIGGIHYAGQLRRRQIETARQVLAETVTAFEGKARSSGVPYSITMDEGDPVQILGSHMPGSSCMVVAREGWFDHGQAGGRSRPLDYLVRQGIHPLIGAAGLGEPIRRVLFVHDGTPHSDRMLDWLLDRDPWPSASIPPRPGFRDARSGARSRETARRRMLGDRLAHPGGDDIDHSRYGAVVFGNAGHPGWINSMRASPRPRSGETSIVVLG